MNFLEKFHRLFPFLAQWKVAKFIKKRWLYKKIVQRWYFKNINGAEVSIELTDRCNLKCAYCPKSLEVGDNKGGDIEWDYFTSIIDKNIYRRYFLTGYGEPTLYPRLVEAVSYIRKKHPTAEIGFNTNATMLSYDLGIKLAEAGISIIRVSINASGSAQYERINNSKGYDRIVQNTIKFLRAINESGKKIVVGLQIFRGKINNEAQIKEFKNFWQPYLGKCGVFLEANLSNIGGDINVGVIERREIEARGEIISENDTEKDAAEQQQTARYPCIVLLSAHIVRRDGKMPSCCGILPTDRGYMYTGNVSDISPKEFYKGDRAKELMRKNLNCEIYDLEPCTGCSAWKCFPNVYWRNPFYPLFGTKWF